MKHIYISAEIFVCLNLFLLSFLQVFSQKPGSQDSSYGTNGSVYFQTKANGILKSKTQPDDKLLILGDEMTMYRLQRNGDIDNSFGIDGFAKVYFDDIDGGDYYVSSDFILQPDGKIILVGYMIFNVGNPGINVIMARLKGDGSLDSSFGDDGRLVDRSNPYTTQDFPQAAVIQANGSILIAGDRNLAGVPYGFIKRYLPNGNIDNTFGNEGTAQSKGAFTFKSIITQPDEKIVVGGADARTPGQYKFSVLRYNENGTPDNNFGNQGVAITDFEGPNESAYSIALPEDGKIVAAGVSKNYITIRYSLMAVARYNTEGAPDRSFGQEGKQTINFINFKGGLLRF